MTLRLARTTLPLAGLVILANIWMAAIYAQSLAALGWGPSTGALGYWAAFFALLGGNNGLALVAFTAWAGAVRREQAAAAAILDAVRWAGVPRRWDARLWLDTPAPVARPTRAWDWHLPYVAGLLAALALPAALAALAL